MTPSRPEPRTAEERAISIIEEIKQYFDTFRLLIDQQEAYKLSAQKCIEHHIQQAIDEAIAEAFKEAGLQQYRDRNDEAEEAYKKGFTDCRERAAKVCDKYSEGRHCSPDYSGHDDRWCGACESINETADVIGQEIRALSLSEEGTK